MESFRQTNKLGGIPSMRNLTQDLTSNQLTEQVPFLQLLIDAPASTIKLSTLHDGISFVRDPLNMVHWRLCLSRPRAHHSELQARLYGLQAGCSVRLVLSLMAPLDAGHSQEPKSVDREIFLGTPRWEEASVRRRQVRGLTPTVQALQQTAGHS